MYIEDNLIKDGHKLAQAMGYTLELESCRVLHHSYVDIKYKVVK